MAQDRTRIDDRNRIYLDNAATSWPKSPAALGAAESFLRECGATSGRGAYQSAGVADRWVSRARQSLADLLGASSPVSIAFCSSGTHALNAGLTGVLRSGDHVVTTSMEHNSLLRPLHQLGSREIAFDYVASDDCGRAQVQDAAKLMRDETRLLAVGHASNVTGAVNQIEPWAELARKYDAVLLVDASQTVGYLPLDVQELGIDLLVAAGHKGLRGLPGTGIVCATPAIQQDFCPLMFGGTGSSSEQIADTPTWPLSIEVGNLNLPGIVSLAVAAEELNALEQLSAGWGDGFERLIAGLIQIPQVRLVGFEDDVDFKAKHWTANGMRVPVVSLTVEGWDVHDLAAVLDTSFGIEVRAGWHCAALVHHELGTAQGGGTIRLSPGRSTTADEIDYTLGAFRKILGVE